MPQMPFDVCHALLRFAWHRSWSVALQTLPPGELQTALAPRQRRHGELAKEALETWNVLVPWVMYGGGEAGIPGYPYENP